MSALPPRVSVTASLEPSGDQLAPLMASCDLVTRRARPPAVGTIQRSGAPNRYDRNATSWPDGDQLGSMLTELILVSCLTLAPSKSMVMISRVRACPPCANTNCVWKNPSSPVKYLMRSVAHSCAA